MCNVGGEQSVLKFIGVTSQHLSQLAEDKVEEVFIAFFDPDGLFDSKQEEVERQNVQHHLLLGQVTDGTLLDKNVSDLVG